MIHHGSDFVGSVAIRTLSRLLLHLQMQPQSNTARRAPFVQRIIGFAGSPGLLSKGAGAK